MLLQRRDGAFRLIRQHDHGLLAGALAFAWAARGAAGPAPSTALATALHDLVWRDRDERPHLDPSSGAPQDFVTIPAEEKARMVARGVDRLRALDPEAGALVEAHHRTLAEGGPVAPESPLSWVRFFDNLSLFACLTPPGSLAEHRPRWLHAAQAAPDGGSLALAWDGDGRLRASPFPLAAPLVFPLTFRDLPERRYASEAELVGAWHEAPEQRWILSVLPPAGAP